VIVLIILAFLLIFSQIQKNGISVKEGFVQTLLLLALFFLVLTELLSAINALKHIVVVFVWIFLDVILLSYIGKNIIPDSKLLYLQILESIKRDKLFFIFCCTFFIPLAFLCYYVPPNNNDSMNYHMARIPMWIYNKNVDFYPTLNGLQLYYNPLAEYIILQLELLTNTIRFANFAQFFAYVGSCVAVSLIVREMKSNAITEKIAFIATATLPVAIFQATTTQNDLVASFFMLVAFYYLQKIDKNNWHRTHVILFSIAIALSGLTKFTGWIFMSPFLLFFSIKKLVKNPVLLIKNSLIISSICCVFMLPYFARNMQTFNSPLGAKPYTELTSGLTLNSFSIQQTTSNTLKNIGVLSILPIQKLNNVNTIILNKIHQLFGWKLNTDLDLKFGNPYNIRFIFFEDTVNNFIHIFFFFIAILYLIIKRNKAQFRIAIFLLIGVVLFSSLIRFQVWNGRLFLPWFMLVIPFLITVFYHQIQNRNLQIIVGSMLVIIGFLCVILNPNKSIIPIKLNERNKIPTLLSNADIDVLKLKNPTLLSTTLNKQYGEKDIFGQKTYQINPRYKATIGYIDSMQKALDFPLQKSIYAKKHEERFYWMDFTLYRLLNNMNQHINSKNTTVGLAIMRGSFEYLIQYSLLNNPNVQHICNVNYPRVLSNLSNTKKAVSYDYLVTNNFQLYPLLDNDSIEYMYDYGMFRLYKFVSTQHKKYVVKDMFNEITSKF
jgi:hypothetical protein